MQQLFRRLEPTARRRRRPPAAWLVLAVAVVGSAFAPLRAWAATITISGYVYHDSNNNGIRDRGEPGVPRIRVRHGSGKAATLAGVDGGYALDNLPASGNLLVESGWFRSQCPSRSTPAVRRTPSTWPEALWPPPHPGCAQWCGALSR